MTNLKDRTGERYGSLVVVLRCLDKIYSSGRKRPQWLCKCDCGNCKKVPGDLLNNMHTTSCGCKRILDLTGLKFGRLTVVKINGRVYQPNKAVRILWLCKCDCGQYTIVSNGNLKSGHTTSCGCMRCSANEALILSLLTKKHINHEREYMFKDLVSNKGNPLRFDFAIKNKDNLLVCLILYQGSQHFLLTDGFLQYGWYQRNVSDEMKRLYCQRYGIKLYYITYLQDTEELLNKILNMMQADTVPSLAVA